MKEFNIRDHVGNSSERKNSMCEYESSAKGTCEGRAAKIAIKINRYLKDRNTRTNLLWFKNTNMKW
jgi:hypothetical protein